MDSPNFLVKAWDKINDFYALRISRRVNVLDDGFVYRRIHPNHVKNGKLTSAAFDDYSLSVDLASLTTPESSRKRAKSGSYGIARLSVRDMRNLPVPQEVKHWPEICNYSHSLVVGDKKKSLRKKIADKAELLIAPASQGFADSSGKPL